MPRLRGPHGAVPKQCDTDVAPSSCPTRCPACQTRLDIIETVMIEDKVIQVNYCEECDAEILMIDEDVESWEI